MDLIVIQVLRLACRCHQNIVSRGGTHTDYGIIISVTFEASVLMAPALKCRRAFEPQSWRLTSPTLKLINWESELLN